MVMAKLDGELTTAYRGRRISLPVSRKQSQEELPYLDTVIKLPASIQLFGYFLNESFPLVNFSFPTVGHICRRGPLSVLTPGLSTVTPSSGRMLSPLCWNAGCRWMRSLKQLSTRGGNTCSEQHSHLELDLGRALERKLAC